MLNKLEYSLDFTGVATKHRTILQACEAIPTIPAVAVVSMKTTDVAVATPNVFGSKTRIALKF